MEEVFADAFRVMINYWMDQESIGDIINFLAVIELAIQTAFMFIGHDGQGTSAPLNEDLS